MTTTKRARPGTPLIDAVLASDAVRLREAVAAGGNIDERDKDGRTPLHHACIQAAEELVDILLAAKADVAAADRAGITPLHFAARSYAIAVAQRLVSCGAPVDAGDANGNTPLSDAVFESQGRGEMIKLLLDSGANKARENKYGVSPASLAATIANYDVKRWL